MRILGLILAIFISPLARGAGKIVNADIAPSGTANIAVNKLAASTANRATAFDASGFISPSAVTATELGYVSGVTSSIQTQLNGKQSTLTIGNLTDVGTDGITVTGGTGAVIGSGTSFAQQVADATHNGYLSSANWSTFNGKQAAGSYLTALTGDVAASGPGSATATLATVNSNVGSFTNGSFTVNAKGLITAASSGTAPVTSLTVASANGFAGSFTAGATPVLTISTSITGILSGNGTAVSAASTQGSGAVVLATSPTITTPTIAALANLTTNGFVKTSGGNGTLGVQTSPIPSADLNGGRTINAQTGTTYTFVLADASNAGGFPLVTGSNASAETFTVPPQSSVVWLAGAQIDVCQIGAGKLTLAQGAGVTINSLAGNKAIGGQYVCVTLVRLASDSWLLLGNLIP